MLINYQNKKMLFVGANDVIDGDNCIILDDKDIYKCFKVLVEDESDVVVRCEKGVLRRLVKHIKENYIYVKAAGGLVRNNKGEMLVMVRNDRYDLPKGKVEPGETLAEAALRETQEETGLSHIELGSLRIKTYHIYNLYGGWHFKQTSWFDMLQLDDQVFVPQIEEGITSGDWVTKDEWCRCLNGSYATMRAITKQMCGN